MQNEAHRGVGHTQHYRQQDMNTSYSNFLATHPLVFAGAKYPLDADDWLHTTESKFCLLHCTEYQKTLYAAQQLRGPAGAQWASYTAALPADHHVAWDEIRVAFRGHHLSVGTVCRKLVEFVELRQGNRSMYEYTQEFNNLAQYSGHHVDTDAKKAELYCKGLNIQLQDSLIQNLILSYNDLASTTIDQEGTMKACEAVEEKKRKRTMSGSIGGNSSSAPPMYRMVYTPPRNSRVDLRSFGATAHSTSSNSTTILLSLYSSKEQLGHHSTSRQWGTCATTVGRLGTSPRNVACQGRPTHLVLQLLWLPSRRASREVQCSVLAAPTKPPWRRYPREAKFLRVRSSSMKTPSLYCLILGLHMIS
jgi:hypothetical protein